MARSPANLFKAFERNEFVAATIVVQRMLAATLGLAVLLAGFGGGGGGDHVLDRALARLALSMRLFRARLGWPRMIRPADARREICKRSLTVTARDIFGLVLARADLLLLGTLATDAVVGQYGSPSHG